MDESLWKKHCGRWLVPLVIIGMAFAVFSQCIGHDFVNYDDTTYITDNPYLKNGLNLGSLLWAFSSTYANFWHPLTWLSHLLDVKLFGLEPGGHHLVNILLHSANGVLLFGVLFKSTGALWRSAIVALLFVVHPMHVESVAWAAERKDTLSTLFWLLTTGAYLWYVKRPGGGRYSLVMLLFVLGMMAKPMLVVLPFTLLLLDYWPLGRITLQGIAAPAGRKPLLGQAMTLAIEKLPLFGISVIVSAVAYYAQASGGAVGSFDSYPLAMRLGNALLSYGTYLFKLFWPFGLTVHYPYPTTLQFGPMLAAASGLLIISVIVARERVKRPYLVVGWLWYLGTLVPVIGLVQLGSHAMADRYTYIPYIGLFVLLVWLVGELFERWSRWRLVTAGLILLILAGLSLRAYDQVQVWRDTETLFTHALEVTSDNLKANNNLGTYQLSLDDLDRAEAYFSKALQIAPDNAGVNYNMGLVLKRQKRFAESEKYFNRALKSTPDLFVAHRDLAETLMKLGRSGEAIEQMVQAVRLQPGNFVALVRLGNALLEAGEAGQAIERYREALKVLPDSYLAYYNLGRAYDEQGDYGKAVASYSESLLYQPYNVRAHNNLGNLLAKLGFTQEALAHYDESIRINPEFKEPYRNKEIILKRIGRSERTPGDL